MDEYIQLDIFENIEKAVLHNRVRHRGLAQRDGTFLSRTDRVNARNKVLTARYYYWTELQRRRNDDVMAILADREFFVEEQTIARALLAENDFLVKLCREKTTRKQLRKMFPGFDWN